MYLRKCSPQDCDLLYRWANDPIVRKNAFNTSKISYIEHSKWFNDSLNLNTRSIFICVEDDIPVGQIRIDNDSGIGIISYTVDEAKRGIGIGSNMIRMIYNIIKFQYPQITLLKGLVKKENIASRKVFRNNEYKETEKSDYIEYTLEICR